MLSTASVKKKFNCRNNQILICWAILSLWIKNKCIILIIVLKFDRWLEGYVTLYSEKKYIRGKLVKHYKSHGYGILKEGIFNILNCKDKQCLDEWKIIAQISF